MSQFGLSGRNRDTVVARLLARSHDRPTPTQDRIAASVIPGDLWDKRQDNQLMVARSRDGLPTEPSIGVQRVSMKAPPGGRQSVKADQAWKYPNNKIVRAESVLINGRYYTDPKAFDTDSNYVQGDSAGDLADLSGTPRRKNESNFFITINPNRKEKKEDEQVARDAFGAALTHLHDNDVLARCLKFGPKSDHFINDRAVDVLLPNIQWTSSVEVGEKQGKMHTHIWMTIEHYSQIQINVRMMQSEFREAYNGYLTSLGRQGMHMNGLPYLQVKLLPQSDWTSVMRQYIQKGMEAAA